ncbi:MAG: arginine--tRNA ligase [Phycisphaerae bacterium]|nr:arginine--tRNA ligase [Phycisphaerae bacterium]
MNVKAQLERRVTAAMAACGADGPAMVGLSGNPKFGDYQANGVMAAAKRQKVNPRQLAEAVVASLRAGAAQDLSDIAGALDVAGPGFINITLAPAFLASELAKAAGDERLDVAAVDTPQTVVVDYSAPNLAKEMHVGHLRSTIIGDAIANVLTFLGHHVVRQNHVGDYGTQFGMLTAYLDLRASMRREYIEEAAASKEADDSTPWELAKKMTAEELSQAANRRFDEDDAFAERTLQGAGRLQVDEKSFHWLHFLDLKNLEALYRDAKKRFDENAAFADMARQYVVRLQAGEEATVAKWREFLQLSMDHCREVYRRLNVNLRDEDIRGESAYGDELPRVVAAFRDRGLLTESDGAQCVFLDGYTNKEGLPLPLIVQKSDEGYLYATTDLAAARYRAETLHADRILIAVDARQSLHLAMVTAAARLAGFLPAAVSMEHVSFGTMLGEDGRPFKTRTGGTVKLIDLLDEARALAMEVVKEKNPDLPAATQEEIADAIGIGAVKYADLSMDRTSDYKFSWTKMLALQGNTAPYMQYAYARIRSIFRKADAAGQPWNAAAPAALTEPAEQTLGKALLRFEEVLQTVAAEAKPNVLTAYLYELAGAFTTFYENCPVLKSDEPIRSARLALCDLTAKTIGKGLELLGIRTIEQM